MQKNIIFEKCFNKYNPTNKCDIEKSKVWRNGLILMFGMLLLFVFCFFKC